MSRSRQLLLLGGFTLLLHIPFLFQPVQGDEVNYLDMAKQVIERPLTPLNFQYVFQGRPIDMAGHPHPPLNAYILALLWVLWGGFSPLFFHGAYLLFALTISFAAYALAARFTTQPLWAALLVASSPLVQVNNNTLAIPEGPTLAFLLLGAALYLRERFLAGGIFLALAGFAALQALALPPILLLSYACRRTYPPRAAWAAAAAPFLLLGAWQALQFVLIHRLPFAVLLGYMTGPTFGKLSLKGTNALVLLQHLGVLVTLLPLSRLRPLLLVPGLLAAVLVPGYPWWERVLLLVFVSLGIHALLWLWNVRNSEPFLASWCLLYFAFALVAFFAGAARYLLPLVVPMVLLVVRQCATRPRWLALALAFNTFLGLNFSLAAYEFARLYPQLQPPPGATFLVNGEWGFRYYMVQQGGRMLQHSSVPLPGEWIVSSEMSLAANYGSLAEALAVPLEVKDLAVHSPLRLLDRYAHSGFSSETFGLLPFSFSSRPVDRITYARTSPFLNLEAPWTPTQFDGRLVYLPASGAAIHLPLEPAWQSLHLALFGSESGQATFKIWDPSGRMLLEERVEVLKELWEPRTVPLDGAREVVLSVEASPGLRAGWGELVPVGSDEPTAPLTRSATAPVSDPSLSYLHLGDLRARPQLLGRWYPIEDGGWRWMGKQAQAVLRTPQESPVDFELRLFFPKAHPQRAGGPVTVSVLLEDDLLVERTYRAAGAYTIRQPVPPGSLPHPVTRVSIRLDRAVPPTGEDRRELGAVVLGFGFAR